MNHAFHYRSYKSFAPGASREAGFGLVEVLIALVVLGVGLLGIAKLVLVSSHANDSAYLRSQATAFAYQVIDNMRANLSGASASSYNTAVGVMPAAAAPCNGSGSNCTNTQMALGDVYAWKQALANALPNGTGSIAAANGFPLVVTVIVRWDDSAAQSQSVFNNGLALGQVSNQQIVLQSVIQ